MSKKIHLHNSDPFCGRVMAAQETWLKMLSKYARLGLPAKLSDFRITCSFNKTCIEFEEEIHAKFAEFVVRRNDIKNSLDFFRPQGFEAEKKRIFAQNEPGLSIISLMLEKACEEIIRDSGNTEALERYKLKNKIKNVLQPINCNQCKASVRVMSKKGDNFSVEISIAIKKKNKKGRYELSSEQNLRISGSRKRIMEEVNYLVKFHSAVIDKE